MQPLKTNLNQPCNHRKEWDKSHDKHQSISTAGGLPLNPHAPGSCLGWWRRRDLQENMRHIWCYKTMCQANSKKIRKPAFLHLSERTCRHGRFGWWDWMSGAQIGNWRCNRWFSMCIPVQLKPRYVTCEYQARTTANHRQHHPGCHISISFFGGIVALGELLCTPPKTNMTMENHHVSIFLIGEYRGYIFNGFFPLLC